MTTDLYKKLGTALAVECFAALHYTFSAEAFLNAVQVKTWLGQNIKRNLIDGYRNLEWNNYKAVFDLLYKEQTYHVGIDFGQQAVHVTLGPGDVYSLYFRNPCGHE
jgi:hypothetical protein